MISPCFFRPVSLPPRTAIGVAESTSQAHFGPTAKSSRKSPLGG
jgi:hypothetical protein